MCGFFLIELGLFSQVSGNKQAYHPSNSPLSSCECHRSISADRIRMWTWVECLIIKWNGVRLAFPSVGVCRRWKVSQTTNQNNIKKAASGAEPAHDIFRHSCQPLDVFFAPKTVAVVGASEQAGSVGRTILWNLISSPFGGTVFPV